MPKYDVAKYNCIYIYSIPDDGHKGLLKIGQTSFSAVESIAQLIPNCPRLKQAADERISQQTKTALVPYELLHVELAVKTITMLDGSKQIQAFEDHDVHDVLLNSGYSAVKFMESGKPSEWYKVDFDTAKKAIQCVKDGVSVIPKVGVPVSVAPVVPKIKLRKEQEENVEYTIDIFNRYDTMLWDCKMRYGKTVTAYELVKRKGYKKVIVITHRPAVADSWGSDHKLMFNGTNNEFVVKTKSATAFDDAMDADNDRKLKNLVASDTPFIYFTSIQDLRESQRVGGKYNKNNAVFDMDWDLLIVDEAHEGTATDLGDAVITTLRKPSTKVLSLSGTPYNIMGDFEENKYTWTYVDEQKAKEKWDEEHPGEKNPYEELPKMNIFTFDLTEQIPTSYRYVTEDSAFNFREFFRTWTGDISKDFYPIPAGKQIGDFVHEEDVNKFLDLISTESEDSNYPFSTQEYRDMFAHTFWIVPGVKEARALSALMKQHSKFKEFEIVNVAGEGDVEKPYDEALALVKSSIKNFDKTITISCGKLTTGITVREWTGVMMLSGSASTAAAGYMQAIFRVQSPGCINGKQKKNCYVFDFAPDRTLKVIAEVHSVTHKGTSADDGAKQALGEFINFCPVIAIEGTVMRTYDVNEMMRQIKRISIDAAINSGFEDDTIYISDAGMNLSDVDIDILRKLSDVVAPQKKGNRKAEVIISDVGLTEEKRKLAETARRKPKRELTPEEKEALELLKKQKEEQKKLYNLLRAVSIRLPLLFYGADADITEIIHLKDFVKIVDEESWQEFMPKGLKPSLFLDILKYYDEDVVVAAGLRIRKMAKAADELPATLRAKRIIEIISKFKNPDKETVLTPWRVVNMHMGDTLGGYNFFDEGYRTELEEPRMIDNGQVTTDVFLNSDAKVLEMNSKSGLYPLYLAYTFYMLNVTGKEKDLSLEETQRIWAEVLEKHIFVLCKTKMAEKITRRTLAGYTGAKVNTLYLTKLVDERMKDKTRLANKLTNPLTWELGGGLRMKFDAIVGNPPYQEMDGGNRASAVPVYQHFVEFSKIIAPYVSLITPSRWFAGGRYLDEFRKNMLQDTHIEIMIDYISSKECFNNADIAGGINYFLWNLNYNGPCTFTSNQYGTRTTAKRFLNEFDVFVRDNIGIEIINKVLSSKDFVPLSNHMPNYNPFLIRSFERGEDKPFAGSVKLKSSSGIGYINRNSVVKNADLIDKYKVMIGKVVPGNGEVTVDPKLGYNVITNPRILEPEVVCTESYFVIGTFDTEIEAVNFAEYMRLKLPRFLLKQTLSSMNIIATNFAFVPKLTASRKWTDDDLCETFGLSEDEKNYVSSYIRTMSSKTENADD